MRVHVKNMESSGDINKNEKILLLQVFSRRIFFAYEGYFPQKRCKNRRNITDIKYTGDKEGIRGIIIKQSVMKDCRQQYTKEKGRRKNEFFRQSKKV